MKLQAVSEVTKSTGFKALEDELAEVIEATRRDWATRFAFPVQDLNVKALRKRIQLSYCQLLSLAAKGFIAQVGTEGNDANVAIMDLLTMHGDEAIAPLNVTPHDFLVLLKEAAGMTIIPSPTVDHSLTELLDKINGTSPPEGRGQVNGSSTTMDATRLAAAAAVTLLAEQLTAAESAVTQATSQLELMRALVDQARAFANEATRCRTTAHETLAVARRAHAMAIDTVDVAIADEAQCVAELNAADMDTVATTKNQLALGAQELFESATHGHEGTVHSLNSLCERAANANAPDDESSVRTQETMAMPRSTSTISTTPTAVTATVTPGSIFPGNTFVRGTSVLHTEITAAIRDSNAPFGGVDARLNASILVAPTIGGRAPIISALKTLLDDGIIKPLLIFHARIVHNAQDRRIANATVDLSLEQAAARIAAIVEAERPANRPTLKGLIHTMWTKRRRSYAAAYNPSKRNWGRPTQQKGREQKTRGAATRSRRRRRGWSSPHLL